MQFTITTAVQALSLILGAAEFALAQETKVTSIFLPENPEHDFAMSVVEVNPSETVYAITCAEGSEDECLMAVTMTVTEGPSSFYHANTMGSTTATISCDIAGPSDAVCEVFVKTEEDSEPLIISPTYSGINLYVEATITAGLEKFEDAAAAEPTSTQGKQDRFSLLHYPSYRNLRESWG